MGPQDIEQKRLYKWMNGLLIALLVAQILLSFRLDFTIGNELRTTFNYDLPTPTCPEGRISLIPSKIPENERARQRQCSKEVKEIYLTGMIKSARIDYVVIHVCMVCAIIVWLVRRENFKWALWGTVIIYGVFFIFHAIGGVGIGGYFRLAWHGWY